MKELVTKVKMYLDINNQDYDSEIIPFIRNGIIIDTSVLLKIIEGLVCTRISKRKSSELEKILRFLDALKLTEKWDKFFITPHILTEVCTHLRNDYDSRKDVVCEVLPIITKMGELLTSKKDFIKQIDLENPIIEAGDISIFVVTDEFVSRKEKITFLSNDGRLNGKFRDHPNVGVLDYQSAIINAL